MNFFEKINTRWDREALASWPSLLKTAYILFPLLIYYLVGDLTEIILWAVINTVFRNASEQTMLTLTKMSGTLQGMIYAIGLIAGLALLRKCAFGEISYLPENEERPKMKPLWIVLLVIISLAVSIGLNYLFSVLGITGSSAGFNDVHEAQFSVNIVAGIIIYGILSPLTEEIIFRGIIYNRLKRIFPLAVSFIVNCILFGIFHGNVVQGLYAVLMSALILLAYEKCKSFWAPIIVHVVANLGVYVLQYTIWK